MSKLRSWFGAGHWQELNAVVRIVSGKQMPGVGQRCGGQERS